MAGTGRPDADADNGARQQLTLGAGRALVGFYYVAVFAAGLLLAWRFNSSRVLFSLLVLLLAIARSTSFPMARSHWSGRTLSRSALLTPLNFVVFAFMRERGSSLPASRRASACCSRIGRLRRVMPPRK